MPRKQDVETGNKYAPDEGEREVSLPKEPDVLPSKSPSRPRSSLILTFLAGYIACIAVQSLCGPHFLGKPAPNTASTNLNDGAMLAPPYVGSTVRDPFPPTSPTNVVPALFPTDVGHAGPTATGAEPAIIATAPSYPIQSGAAVLVVGKSKKDDYKKDNHEKGNHGKGNHGNILKKWGNLSPWYSVDQDAFGLNSSPETPETCRVTGLHLLHRHGARYPSGLPSYGSPGQFATKVHKSPEKWNATGNLEFLNEWTYKLGEELLTPFGRKQLFDLGLSMRLKYGFLLKNFTESNTIPVFRTESQHRMLASAQNFAIGFFGYPFEGQFQQSITIEAKDVNNTLAPFMTCPNFGKGGRASRYVRKWVEIYLKDAVKRMRRKLKGFHLNVEDVYAMQQLCAYETVALGYSRFCQLFKKEEWDGFDYSHDLQFWYGSAFGSPVARALGIGWVKELVARLTHTRIKEHNSSTNSDLDDCPITFPVNQSLYVDATHDILVLNVLTALNLTNFAASGPLPYHKIPDKRSFRASELAPFATNVQFQLLQCTSLPGEQIRIIINDGVTPLTSIKGCPEQADGMCPVNTFVAAQQETISEVDWEWDCHGDWDVDEGDAWDTTTGSPPLRHRANL